MSLIKFKQGLKANLPSTGTDDSTIYFCTDTQEIYKSSGNGNPLLQFSTTVLATETTKGLMSASDKTKLNSLEVGGNSAGETPPGVKLYL